MTAPAILKKVAMGKQKKDLENFVLEAKKRLVSRNPASELAIVNKRIEQA